MSALDSLKPYIQKLEVDKELILEGISIQEMKEMSAKEIFGALIMNNHIHQEQNIYNIIKRLHTYGLYIGGSKHQKMRHDIYQELKLTAFEKGRVEQMLGNSVPTAIGFYKDSLEKHVPWLNIKAHIYMGDIRQKRRRLNKKRNLAKKSNIYYQAALSSYNNALAYTSHPNDQALARQKIEDLSTLNM